MAPRRRMTNRGRGAPTAPVTPTPGRTTRGRGRPRTRPITPTYEPTPLPTPVEEMGSDRNQEPRSGDPPENSADHAIGNRTNSPHNLHEGRMNQSEDTALEKFLKFHPPAFLGEAEQEQKAERWIEQIEKIFAALQYPEERMVRFAAFMLGGPAYDWWQRIQEDWAREELGWTWERFTEAFRAEYLPPWIMEKREDEFQSLKQGDMTVAQYAAQFARLSKYCRCLVDTEKKRTRQFIKGLRMDLQTLMAANLPTTYTAAVDAATRIDNAKKNRMMQQTSESSKQSVPPKQEIGKRPAQQQWEDKSKQARTITTNSVTDNLPTCRSCGKRGHIERDCWNKDSPRRCFNCGNPGHLRNNCPKPLRVGQGSVTPLSYNSSNLSGQHGNESQKSQVKAKMFALDQTEDVTDAPTEEEMK